MHWSAVNGRFIRRQIAYFDMFVGEFCMVALVKKRACAFCPF